MKNNNQNTSETSQKNIPFDPTNSKDCNTSVQNLKQQVKLFCEQRGWDSFHSAKDLAIGVVTEASELLELFRFQKPEDLENFFKDPQKKQEIRDEIADVLFCLLRFCQLYDLDLSSSLAQKMKKNAKKYPI